MCIVWRENKAFYADSNIQNATKKDQGNGFHLGQNGGYGFISWPDLIAKNNEGIKRLYLLDR